MSPTNPKPNRLREFREAAGLTQQQLADEVCAGRSTIIRAEQGTQSPTLELADRLADVLDTSIDELFSGSDRETLDKAYWRGRRNGLDERERGRRDAGDESGRDERVAADTADPYEVAAFVDTAVRAKPSATDPWQVWRLPDPRRTARKLDAVVTVQVFRRPPRAAKRLYDQTVAALRGESDTEGAV
jgi:putative transcriptional regulator